MHPASYPFILTDILRDAVRPYCEADILDTIYQRFSLRLQVGDILTDLRRLEQAGVCTHHPCGWMLHRDIA